LAVLHCALHLTLSRIKLRSQNNLPCVHRSQPSRHCFQPPLTPPDQRFVFRVFRGERWFRVENTVIEQVYARLARAKAQATVSGPWCHECSRNPRSRHSAFFRVLPRPKQGHTRDSFSVCSVCSVVSDGFGLKTALSNKWMRDLPGLKPRLRFLAGGGTNARAIRGHVIPRSSAFFRVLPRSSAFFCGQKKTHPRFLFRVFRVFRGERWFPVENTVIEQVYARLARAKAQATVSGPWCHECPRKTGSRHSAFFRGQNKDTPAIPFPCVPW
jgi:hypothetical protein